MEYEIKYTVRPTKTAYRDGKNLPITEKEKLEIIGEMRNLKYWPDNQDLYDFEMAFGALEFKFRTKDHWIRVFVYKDDERKIMWVLGVRKKDTNKLTRAHQILIETGISRVKEDLKNYRKEQAEMEKKNNNLKLVKGDNK